MVSHIHHKWKHSNHHQHRKSWQQSSGTERDIICWLSVLRKHHKCCYLLWDPKTTVFGWYEANSKESVYFTIMPTHTLLVAYSSYCRPSSWKFWPIHCTVQIHTKILLVVCKVEEHLAVETLNDNDEVQHVVMAWLREQAEDYYDVKFKTSFPGSLNALRSMMIVKN